MFSIKKNQTLLACLLTAIVLMASVGAGYAASPSGEKYPERAVTIIVPFAPGGGVDLVARVVANFLSKEWGVPVNVVNKEGGNTVIGNMEVMKSKPNGYTVLADGPASSSYQVILPNLPYKIEDRTPLAIAAVSTHAFVVNSKSQWKNLRDVADAAKRDPENFRWGSLGGVSSADLRLQQFFASAGTDLSRTKIVRFKGAGDAIIALAGGHIDFTNTGVPAMMSYNQSGLVRAVAVSRPVKEIPGLKSAADQGFAGVLDSGWFGYSGPSGVPKSVVAAWEQAMEKIVKSAEFREQIEKIGNVTLFMKSDEWRPMIQKEMEAAQKYFVVKGK